MQRTRVLGPDEEPVPADFYSRTGHDPQNHTAFRQAERRYKRKGSVDLSAVIDFGREDDRVVHLGRYALVDPLAGTLVERPIYGIKGYDGFVYVPGAVPLQSQIALARQCFESYMNPPNVSNLDTQYDFGGDFAGLHDALCKGRLGVTSKQTGHQTVLSSKSDIERLIRRVRWVTLGYQYDWTTKSYDFDRSPNPFPADLAAYSQGLANAAGFPSLVPQAGIVNYYQPGDSLTGHVDRSERNMDAPLVSVSLGAGAVFLLGGAGRDDPVAAMMVRSGDVSFLSGPSRKYYHGVPRVLADDRSDDALVRECPLLKNARLNVNIRQVLCDQGG